VTPAEFTPDDHTAPHGGAGADGPVEGALLPLVRINGALYVVEGCLHFFPRHPHAAGGEPGEDRGQLSPTSTSPMTRPGDPWPLDTNPDHPPAPRRRLPRAESGDCSRKRRSADPARLAYYARHRQQRFARWLFG
jgi:hypothetical protein